MTLFQQTVLEHFLYGLPYPLRRPALIDLYSGAHERLFIIHAVIQRHGLHRQLRFVGTRGACNSIEDPCHAHNSQSMSLSASWSSPT
ncbi:hypothetical protein D3C78_1451960 [compost metagenome]